MKTFNDLEFKELDSFYKGVQSRIQFDNGYGATFGKKPRFKKPFH
jgi:hypothetical protein